MNRTSSRPRERAEMWLSAPDRRGVAGGAAEEVGSSAETRESQLGGPEVLIPVKAPPAKAGKPREVIPMIYAACLLAAFLLPAWPGLAEGDHGSRGIHRPRHAAPPAAAHAGRARPRVPHPVRPHRFGLPLLVASAPVADPSVQVVVGPVVVPGALPPAQGPSPPVAEAVLWERTPTGWAVRRSCHQLCAPSEAGRQ